jgi:hypothetical protein
VTVIDWILVVYGIAGFLVGMLASTAPYEEVEPPHLGGTRRLDANDPTTNEENAA